MRSRKKIFNVYIVTNRYHTVLYTGMTGRGHNRIFEHKSMRYPSFTCRYKVTKLVHWEEFENVLDAIAREKQIKRWSRAKKIALIEKYNPEWLDLYNQVII